MLDLAPRPALPEELPGAFELLFSHLGTAERSYRVARALELAAQGELDAQGIFVLPGDANPAGVCVCQAVPGAGSLIWPPTVTVEPRVALEDGLIQHACAWLRRQGVRLAQCLLADEEERFSPPLIRNGFHHITGLSYLRHELHLPADLLGTPVRLTLESYTPTEPLEFHRALAASYDQTLDCPEVNGLRSVAEVVEGHQAQGGYDPSRWWLARYRGESAGVLIVVEPTPGEWEVAYMGLTPAMRGRGLGRELLLHALCEARAAGAYRVILSVDDRNSPAFRLYRGVGFETYDHRLVMLRAPV